MVKKQKQKHPAWEYRKLKRLQVQFLGREDPLEKGMATHSGILDAGRTVTKCPIDWSYLAGTRKSYIFLFFSPGLLCMHSEVLGVVVSLSHWLSPASPPGDPLWDQAWIPGAAAPCPSDVPLNKVKAAPLEDNPFLTHWTRKSPTEVPSWDLEASDNHNRKEHEIIEKNIKKKSLCVCVCVYIYIYVKLKHFAIQQK